MVFGMSACRHSGRTVDLSNVKIKEIHILNYGKVLFSLKPDSLVQGLESIATDYKVFLGTDYSDSLNILQLKDFITDPFNRKIARACAKEYPNLNETEKELTRAFRYYRYYFPEAKIPVVYSYVSGLLYESPVQYLDSVMIIAQDMYLGKDFEPYKQVGLPMYKVDRMTSENIVPDCMKAIAYSLIGPGMPENTLLDQMILHGKALYFLDLMMPGIDDSLKIGFTGKQLEWCRRNEKNIWAYLIENEMLYSTDSFIIDKFILDGPFTSGFPGDAPAMMGKWIGWQIVRSYMDHHKNKSLQDLIALYDSQQILTDSKYKPRK